MAEINQQSPQPRPGPRPCSCPAGTMATSGIDPRTGCPPCITPPTNEYGGTTIPHGSKQGPGGSAPKGGKRKMTPRSRISDKNTQYETY